MIAQKEKKYLTITNKLEFPQLTEKTETINYEAKIVFRFKDYDKAA